MEISDDVTVEMPAPRVRERPAVQAPCLAVFGAALAGLVVAVVIVVLARGALAVGLAILVAVASAVLATGLTQVAPGQARVVQFLGRYIGTVRTAGLRWVMPFSTRRILSTRIRNHESAVLKVNDADGNPIDIAAVVVWQVTDTAQASFEVDDFLRFVGIQTETAVRHIANRYQ